MIKINYKLLRQEIQQSSNQQNAAEILSFLGYEISKDFKFRLRGEEKTPSASISKVGRVMDFGTGESHDLVSILFSYHNTKLSDATCYVAKLLNIDIERFKNE